MDARGTWKARTVAAVPAGAAGREAVGLTGGAMLEWEGGKVQSWDEFHTM